MKSMKYYIYYILFDNRYISCIPKWILSKCWKNSKHFYNCPVQYIPVWICSWTFTVMIFCSILLKTQYFNITLMSFSFPFAQQKGHMVARANWSPASTTQRYERSSSSFSAGCANTLTAVRTSASNSTTNGASGCRKPRKHTTRSVRTKRTPVLRRISRRQIITLGTHEIQPHLVVLCDPHKREPKYLFMLLINRLAFDCVC